MDSDFQWYGNSQVRRIQEAQRVAIDEVTQLATQRAVALVPVVTGTLQGSIRHEPATIARDGAAEGEFGSYDVVYALPVETRTPYLRPAFDAYVPSLPERIARRLNP